MLIVYNISRFELGKHKLKAGIVVLDRGRRKTWKHGATVAADYP